MQKLTQHELNVIIACTSERLDLSGFDLLGANLQGASLWGASLQGANLEGANLCGCTGERERIKSIFISDTYPITYTIDRIQIGCKNHSIEDWKSFDDYEISKMDYAALEWWNDHKDFIFKTIERFPAEK